jgi:glycine/D-amino acid oxidase-like deaminating enzyme
VGSALNPPQSYGGLSLWHETTPTDWTPRPSLDGTVEADVAIVGAGYTGLWTAYYLSVADPSLRIVVAEAEVAGFGASGRNGGWCSALFPTSLGEAQDAAMRASVDEVGRVAAAEGIDCHFAKGGNIVLARSPAQWTRAQASGDRLLDAAEAGERLRATRTLGATYTPDCAAIHPGRLVRGLASVVERRGVTLFELSPAVSIAPGEVRTPGGSIRARYVVRATEGFTPRLPGLARWCRCTH